jgi:hypothetical protein
MIDTGTIEVDRLTKRFGSVTAVDDLSFTVRPAGPKPRTATVMAGKALAHSSTVPAAARWADLLMEPSLVAPLLNVQLQNYL